MRTDIAGNKIRLEAERREHQTLSPFAAFSDCSRGRLKPEAPCPIRAEFARDRDRIVHSKAFRRLKHKTQVFLSPDGDHYRTRLTHTLEVSQVARTIARALSLNEDLTEAIALGHDLGHTPFGHAGERALSKASGMDFRHNENSVRVVDFYEKGGEGLNLTHEVRDGILCHTGGKAADTLEGRIVKYADRIAYINHDIDDAMRAGVLAPSDIPRQFTDVLGDTISARIDRLVTDLVSSSGPENGVFVLTMSPEIDAAMNGLRDFMFARVYTNPVAKGEETKAIRILEQLYAYFQKNPDKLPPLYYSRLGENTLNRVICDYISSMTDRYAVEVFKEIFVPKSWHVL